MKLSANLVVLVALLAILTGCTNSHVRQFVGSAIADGADTQVKYNAQECRTLQQRCVQGDFQEWETSDKEMGCSCKKL